jgi:hypothetical protein
VADQLAASGLAREQLRRSAQQLAMRYGPITRTFSAAPFWGVVHALQLITASEGMV